ncbi:MAG TPA: metal ABC transporter permease, partial [Trueperaceae bacterium]|nr:metal ABC transporter permease [Trueperaceae bacterium]
MSLTDALALPFFQRAVLAGLAIAVMSGVLGVFVVQRRLSFLGDGLAHAAFGGMGIGAFVIVTTGLIGSSVALLKHPLWIALPFSVLAALDGRPDIAIGNV